MQALSHVGHVTSQDRVYSGLVSWSRGFKPRKNIFIHPKGNRPFCHWENKRRLIPEVIRKICEFSRCRARDLRSRKGYITIPGTESSFKLGGYAKIDAIVLCFDDLNEGSNPDNWAPFCVQAGRESSSRHGMFPSRQNPSLVFGFRRRFSGPRNADFNCDQEGYVVNPRCPY